MFEQARGKILGLRTLFLLALGLLAARLFWLQVLEHDYWYFQGFLNRERILPRPVKRGAILDRKGRRLAWDEPAHDVELVYRDFRRGNPLGQAFHLRLLVLPDPRLPAEIMELYQKRMKLRGRIRSLPAGSKERASLEERLASMKRVTPPDPRPYTLLRAREEIPRLARFAAALGPDELPDPEKARADKAAGLSREDAKARARVVRSNMEWYLRRLLGEALAEAARTKGWASSLEKTLERMGRGSLARGIRREFRRAREEGWKGSFAARLGLGPGDLEALLEKGAAALVPPRPRDRDPLELLDRIHKRNTCLLLFQFGNRWALWDRRFRDAARLREDRRDPLWRAVPFELVKWVELSPRAHRGFFVVDSVRRVYRTVEGRLPAARLFGRVTGVLAGDKDKLDPDTTWLQPLPGLEDYWPEYEESVEKRARRLASRVRRFGRGGLEGELDSVLRGKEGWTFFEADRKARRRLSHYQGAPRPGRDVRITLDLDLQCALERALARAKLPVSAAGAALLACRTGEILALASLPLAGREDLDRGWKELARLARAWREGGRRGRRPATLPILQDWSRFRYGPSMPGSTFKVVTALAGFREGKVGDLYCRGILPFPWGGGLHCPRAHGRIGLERALECSCNVYFGRLARTLGNAALEKEAALLGFSTLRGRQVEIRGWWKWAGPPWGPGGRPPRVPCDPPVVEAQAAPALHGVGYGVGATPLAMARVFAALATGVVPPLRIVPGGPGGGRSLDVSPGDLARIREGLRLVVEGPEGTARRAGLGPLGVIGKTGTPQLVRGPRGRNLAWFCGLFPGDHPLYSIAVMVPGVPHGFHGGSVAAPVVRAFLEDPGARSLLERKGGGR